MTRWHPLPRITLALTLFAFAAAHCGRADEEKPATLKVLLPQRLARILINDKDVSVKGAKTREVTAPALPEGKKQHEVTVTWRTNNYTRFYRTAMVTPVPGKTVTVDLSKPDPKKPDRIEIRFVPTPVDVVQRMCQMAKVGKEDVVYDLGCGDGRMVILAVKEFGAKRGVGIDLDPERISESEVNAKYYKVADKVKFRVGDVLDIKDLKDASVVLLYMGDDVNIRLRPILQKTLKPGSRIVSHRFKMGDWKPEKTEKYEAEDGDLYELHLWTIPKK
jgi:uncharacterized protein (TIGR03000 family)